jgi:hypothetical protein
MEVTNLVRDGVELESEWAAAIGSARTRFRVVTLGAANPVLSEVAVGGVDGALY